MRPARIIVASTISGDPSHILFLNTAVALLRSHLSRLLTMLLLCTATVAAVASEYSEIQRLANAGQTQQALERAGQGIAKNPKDPQLRFLQGVIQSDAGMTDAAEQSFIALTRLYPELPEPYNNLAALYARTNRFGKAREALESALRLNPGYAVAHENLGDVYARLAAESYANAQALDRNNPRLAPKLGQVRQLLTGAATAPQ